MATRHHRRCDYHKVDGHCTCGDIAIAFEAELDEAIQVLKSHVEVLHIIHRNHGGSPAFEDVCCREIGKATHVLAEYERRHEETP